MCAIIQGEKTHAVLWGPPTEQNSRGSNHGLHGWNTKCRLMLSRRMFDRVCQLQDTTELRTIGALASIKKVLGKY
jgi:hypothetical protein